MTPSASSAPSAPSGHAAEPYDGALQPAQEPAQQPPEPTPQRPLVAAARISLAFSGSPALSDVDFDILAGEVHAVLGENGSGKSTLLGIASGTVKPDGGVIEIMGRPLTAADPLQARSLGLATVYQDDSLVRELTVAQNLLLAATDGISYGAMNGWAEKQLAAYDLDLAPDAVVGDLTPAERQFLEIVKALISRNRTGGSARITITKGVVTMRMFLVAALLAGTASAPALAQNAAPFTGPRIEGVVGWAYIMAVDGLGVTTGTAAKPVVQGGGLYRDLLVKTPDGWRFKSRTVAPGNSVPLPLPGT